MEENKENFLEKFIEEIEKRGGWSTEELKEILFKLLVKENWPDLRKKIN